MASDLTLQEGLCDVILKVRHDGLSWRMPAHSLILASKSSLFKEFLDERSENEKPIPLSVIDMKPETAVAVLKYIYENEFPTEVTADLLLAAKNYRLELLRDNLETRLKDDLTIHQACQILQELVNREPANGECCIKKLCFNLLEMHALVVFGSDMIQCLNKKTLCALLASDYLNVPDDAYLFWGIWRWGRRQSSMNGRSLLDKDVATYIDDLIVLIRRSSLKNKNGISSCIYSRFNTCKIRRTMYLSPPKILNHAIAVRPCPAWEDVIPSKMSEADEGPTCIQFSVEKDVMLVGLSLEVCAFQKVETIIRVFREFDNAEVCRQKVEWHTSSMSKFSTKGEPENRLESQLIFHTPLFLAARSIYSVVLLGSFSACYFVWGSFKKKRVKIGNTFIQFHGHGITSTRELYIIPDLSVTWGPRIF